MSISQRLLGSSLLLAALVVGGAGGAAGCEATSDTSSSEEVLTARSANLEEPSITCVEEDGIAVDLRCAGLYANWDTKTVAPNALEYTPAYALWSDGAQKTRWVVLPPGTKIDVHDMDAWVFPVGTKLFKEFRLDVGGVSRRIETRFLWKRAEDRWEATKYLWSADEREAKRFTGSTRPIAGSSYQVPGDGSCMMCHRGAKDRVLGLGAVLSAAPEAHGLTYASLLQKNLLDGPAIDPAALQIPGNAVEREAIGRLHVGCGVSCHNTNGYQRFQMRVDVVDGKTPTRPEETKLYRTGVGHAGSYGLRIAPGDEERSGAYVRMATRGSGQMPPIATQIRDEATLDAIRTWIRSLPSP